MTRAAGVRKPAALTLVGVLVILAVVSVARLGAVAAPRALKAPPPPPPPPTAWVLGDSNIELVAQHLTTRVRDESAGGSTGCDTAATIPAGSPAKVLLGVSGHSWGNYDAAHWQGCTLAIIDALEARGATVYVVTAPTPLAIYCANPFYVALAEAAGNPHTTGDYGYELRQRILDANAWKVQTLPGLRPRVRLVRLEGLEHYGQPDCAHFTDAGATAAAAKVEEAWR